MEWCIGPRPQVHLEKPPCKKTMEKRGKNWVPPGNSGNSLFEHQHVQEVLSNKNWRWILWSQRFFEQEWPYQPDTNRQQTSARKNQTEILVPRSVPQMYQRRRQPHETWKCKVLQQPCRNWGGMALQNGGSFCPFPQQELTQYFVKVV